MVSVTEGLRGQTAWWLPDQPHLALPEWPALDTSHEEQVRQQLADALTGQAAPDSRTAALVALLYALRCEHKVVDPRPYGMSRGQLRARALEIAMDSWVSAAVREVIAETIVVGAGAAGVAAVGV